MPGEQRGNEPPERHSPSEYIPYEDMPTYPSPPYYPPPAGGANQGGGYPPPPVPPGQPYPQQPTPPPWPYQQPQQPQQPPTLPYQPGIAGPQPASPLQKRSRRIWWIAGLAIIVLAIAISSLFLIGYLNRSTPDRTLDSFCNAVLQGDYQTAYDLFSPQLQQRISEPAFASTLSQDKVTACLHGSTGDSGNSVTNSLTLVHASHGKNSDIVMLTKDSNNDWKINDIFKQA
jgi:hypothetical protein